MRPDASLVGRGGGSRIPSCTGGGGAARSFSTRPPCVSTKVTSSCLTPSSRTSKSPFDRSATNWPWPSRTMTSVVTRSTLRRMTSPAFGVCGVSTPSGFLSCAESAATAANRANATKYLRMVLSLYAPARLPPDDRPDALEDAFVLLERRRHLVRGAPGVGVQTFDAGFQLGASRVIHGLLVQSRDDVYVSRAQLGDRFAADARRGRCVFAGVLLHRFGGDVRRDAFRVLLGSHVGGFRLCLHFGGNLWRKRRDRCPGRLHRAGALGRPRLAAIAPLPPVASFTL